MVSKIGLAVKISVLVLLLLGIGIQSSSAVAQTPDPQHDEACLSCHRNLYILHDTGKYYCLCAARAECTFCHGGVAGTYDMEKAHEGLIANPIKQDSSVCERCHPQDAAERIAYFVSHAGVRTPLVVEEVSLPPVTGSAHVAEALQTEPTPFWMWLVYFCLVITALGIGFFAIRCYRQDCLQRKAER